MDGGMVSRFRLKICPAIPCKASSNGWKNTISFRPPKLRRRRQAILRKILWNAAYRNTVRATTFSGWASCRTSSMAMNPRISGGSRRSRRGARPFAASDLCRGHYCLYEKAVRSASGQCVPARLCRGAGRYRLEAGRRKFRPSDNSRDTAATLIAWGDEFSRQHEDTDWTEKEYLDEIYRFTDEKLRSVPGKDDPNAEFDIAFLNRVALERHGYDTATITDSDLQELAGRMGDYYCESCKFSEDLRTACGDFGLSSGTRPIRNNTTLHVLSNQAAALKLRSFNCISL